MAAVIACRDTPSLESAIDAILAGDERPDEILVVDDASARPICPREGVRVVRPPHWLGRGGARNLGAAMTTAPLLWFVDADVKVGPTTLTRLRSELVAGPASGVMGSYADDGRSGYGGFRLVHHRYQLDRNPEPLHLSAACLLIYRRVFDSLGGFADLQAGEDIALGVAGARQGHRWKVVLAAEVLHVSNWRSLTYVRRDFSQRGRAAAALAQRRMAVMEHAARPREVAAAALQALTVVFTVTGLRPALAPLVGWVLADLPWFRYAVSRRGPAFAVRSAFDLFVFRSAVMAGFLRQWRR